MAEIGRRWRIGCRRGARAVSGRGYTSMTAEDVNRQQGFPCNPAASDGVFSKPLADERGWLVQARLGSSWLPSSLCFEVSERLKQLVYEDRTDS